MAQVTHKLFAALVGGMTGFLTVGVCFADVCSESCEEAPLCSSLGYKLRPTTTSGSLVINSLCSEGYVVCPFDSNYIWCKQYTCADGGYSSTNNIVNSCTSVFFHGKRCYDCNCSGYPLTTKSAAGIYDVCYSGSAKRYRLVGCKEGYMYVASRSMCMPGLVSACLDSAYSLKYCPTHATCSTCQSGSTLLYKIDSCEEGYQLSDNQCVRI